MQIDRAQRFLFVIGHGRSGTTIMQRGLNCSANIHLLSEANWHNFAPNAHGFADWYNSMHRSFNNPPCKGDRCPEISGSLSDVIEEIGKNYLWIGDKIAFADESLGYDRHKAIRFFARWFPKAHYIMMLRDPVSVILSAQALIHQNDISVYVSSYIKNILNLANFYLTFDHSIMVDFTKCDRDVFALVGDWLGEDLSDAPLEWEPGRNEQKSADISIPGIDEAQSYYERVSRIIDPLTLRIIDRRELRRIQLDLYRRFDSGT